MLGRESSPGLSVPDLVDDGELAPADLLAVVILGLVKTDQWSMS